MNIDCAYDELVDLHKLQPNPKNPNKHPKEQIDRLSKIIDYQGMRAPIVVSNRSGFITKGHGRLEALKKLGWEKGPVDFQDYEDEAQEYADIVADNAIAEWAAQDLSDINTTMLDMGPDFDIDMLGIKDFVIEPIEKYDEETQDDVPEVKHDPITKRGDVWLLGEHRVMCGDSTMIDDVEKLMNGEKADMVFTSPPYNANAKTGDGDIFNSKKSKKMYQGAFIDNQGSKEYIDFTKNVLDMCFMQTEGFIFWNVSYNAKSRFEYIKQIEDKIEYLIEQICWKKSSTIPFKGSMMRDWEPIYLFSTDKSKLGLKSVVSNHWEVNNTNSQGENHKACFPVGLPEKGMGMIKDSSKVFEPFCGSGSTLIACEKTNRKCYGMELDEHYCDVIIERWEKFTGKQATLESTNQTYEELKNAGR